MTRIEVIRQIAADPASVALLLADPSGQLWPAVSAVPPQRTATAFVAVIRLGDGLEGGDEEGGRAHGAGGDAEHAVPATLSLGYTDTRDGVRATRATLRIVVDGETAAATTLRELGVQFLDRLAAAAEARAFAA